MTTMNRGKTAWRPGSEAAAPTGLPKKSIVLALLFAWALLAGCAGSPGAAGSASRGKEAVQNAPIPPLVSLEAALDRTAAETEGMLAPGTAGLSAQDIDALLAKAEQGLNAGSAQDSSLGKRRRVAVLNFASPEKGFSDYMAEALITRLTQGGALTALSRQEMAAVQKELDSQAAGEVSDSTAVSLGKKLGAQWVITGSIEAQPGFYRYYAKLLSVESGEVGASVQADVAWDGKAAQSLPAPPGVKSAAAAQAQANGGELAFNSLYSAIPKDGDSYTITISRDTELQPMIPDFGGKKVALTVRSEGEGIKTLTAGTTSPLFTIGEGVTLYLENVILKGSAQAQTGCCVQVVQGGTLVMNEGAGITGFKNRGVYVESGGTFTMNGGAVSGNTSSGAGGGVYVGGTFTMNGGAVSGNTASGGGGVCVVNGTFTMNGGAISGNTSSFGGGVYVVSGGIFTMKSGIIGGNTAASGGGVYVYRGTFTKTSGGILYGSNANDPALRNTVSRGTGAAANNRDTTVGAAAPLEIKR